MLQTKNEFPGNVTLFEKVHEGSDWMVRVTMNKKVIKEAYCLNEEHANIVRGMFVNEFWSNKLN